MNARHGQKIVKKRKDRCAFLILALGIACSFWRNLEFSWIASWDPSNIVDAPDNDGTTKKELWGSSVIPQFPRWKDPKGIQWRAIESYIRYADQNLDSGKNLLECPKGGCPVDMPNIIYVFGARFQPAILDSSTNPTTGTGTNNTPSSAPSVWVEGRRRKLVGVGFAKRYPIVEELMDRSLHYLLTNHDIVQSKFPRLLQVLLPPSLQMDDTTHHIIAGIPLITNFGDNRQCHYQNLKQNGTETLDVPVFTLSVPTNCQFAFPIPHPAVLDTAKVYGHQWDFILEHRRRLYPIWNQTSQAVWRGSPTGGLMRQKLVYAANTVPNHLNANFSTTDTWFDVGFGKPYHKIDSKYKGPRIRGRSRIWFEDFAYYSMVLDADGSSWSERFPCLLCLNTVVAKLDPSFVDYLWPTTQQHLHFVSIAKDASDLWSVVPPLLNEQTKRADIIERAHEWCTSHMTYEAMIHFFLKTLEDYITWLDRRDPNWLAKWHRLFLDDMPPKHHHWLALPVQKPKQYFPVWRENEVEETDDIVMEEEDET